MSVANSEAPSDAALMVFATLSNPSKVDPALASASDESKAQENLNALPVIKEKEYASGSESDTSNVSGRSGKSSVSRRSKSSKRSASGRSDYESDDARSLKNAEYTFKKSYDKETYKEKNYNREKYLEEAESEVNSANELLEKQSLLLDLQRLKLQGITLTKEWSIEDKIEDMTLEIKRHTLHIDEMANVQTMRDGLRFLCTGIEMLNNRIGLLDLDGWSTEVCKDLTKHDANLSKIYRKYWRRTGSTIPEMDIAASMIASMGMYHFKQKMSKKIYDSRPHKPSRKLEVEEESEDESEDEEAPP